MTRFRRGEGSLWRVHSLKGMGKFKNDWVNFFQLLFLQQSQKNIYNRGKSETFPANTKKLVGNRRLLFINKNQQFFMKILLKCLTTIFIYFFATFFIHQLSLFSLTWQSILQKSNHHFYVRLFNLYNYSFFETVVVYFSEKFFRIFCILKGWLNIFNHYLI